MKSPIEALVAVAIVVVMALVLGMAASLTPTKNARAATPPHQMAILIANVPLGPSVWEFTHDGNKYLIVGGGVHSCIIPALPPKAEKEPGHAE